MRFLSVCSGIEAASVAWGPLGWKAVAFSEIEPFPCAVLDHHYPGTPNLGDMTKFKEWNEFPIDLLCGGTPCQSFSVAGLRKGLDDPRGNLMLTFGAIAAKYRPKWLVWENVPGVLSSNGGADFGAFLGMLGQLGYGFAYRVLDAQYFGVAQRRRRVFVVGCFGDWRSAAAVLFERHSLQGHPAPRRESGQTITPTIRAGASYGSAGHGARSGDSRDELIVPVAPTMDQRAGRSGANSFATSGGLIPVAYGGNNQAGPIDVATARNACSSSSSGRLDFETETFLVQPTAHTLRGEGFDASEDGTGRGTPLVPVVEPITLALRGREGAPQLEYRQDGTANALLTPNGGRGGIGVGAVAYTTKLHNTQSNQAGKVYEEYATSLDRCSPPPALLTPMQVRRLTPVECARLQGFPDDYLDITYRNKPAADGNKYKALGNSWAVPNVAWIGRRIDFVESLQLKAAA